MTEKEMFLNSWKREHAILMRVLGALPEDKIELKPSEKSRTAKELAWVFAQEESILDGALNGVVDFSAMPPSPETYAGILSALDANSKKIAAKVKKAKPGQWNRKINWMVAPGKIKKLRAADVAWFVLMDRVHHRGQFSVYLRLAGAQVPSIYGPTADEPWM